MDVVSPAPGQRARALSQRAAGGETRVNANMRCASGVTGAIARLRPTARRMLTAARSGW